MRSGYTAIAPALPQSGARLLEAHRHVLDALRRHDAEAAITWTRKHLLDHKRGFEFAGLDMDSPIPGG
jgi:DNA-binding GntR family transcriptional regulator